MTTRTITRHLAFALCTLVCTSAQVEAQRAAPTLDSPVQTTWTRRAPTRVFDALGRASNTTVWILGDAALPRYVTIKGEGRSVRGVLDALTQQLGVTWSEESGLVLILSAPTDDPLRGKAGETVVGGRTLRAWRVELCRARRTSQVATQALIKGGEPGLTTLVQAAINGPYRARSAATEALRRSGDAGAALLLARLDTASRMQRSMIESLLRRMPSAAKIVTQRLNKGTLAQRLEALRMLASMRTVPDKFAKAFTGLLDDPQLAADERSRAARLVARLLQNASDKALPEAYAVWIHLRATGDPRLVSESAYGLQGLTRRAISAKSDLAPAARSKLLDQLATLFLSDLRAPRARREAAHSLALLAGVRPKLLNKLVAMLEAETDPRTQAMLVEALGRSKNPNVVPLLLKQLAATPTLERAVGSALSRVGADGFPALFAALTDPSPLVRRVACRAFGGVNLRPRATTRGGAAPDARPRVVKSLTPLVQDADPDVRRAALYAIARCGDLGHAVVLRSLEHIDDAVRRAAIQAVNSSSSALRKAALPRLIKCLASTEPETRIAATLAIKRLGKEAGAAGPALIRLLKDPDDKVAAGSASALISVPCDAAKAVPFLVPLLSSRVPASRYQALAALRAFGPKAASLAIPALVKLGSSNDPEDLRIVLEAFGVVAASPDAAALKIVVQAAQSPDAGFRGLAAAALVALAPTSKEAQGLLFVLVEDENSSVRVAACKAYGALPTIPKDQREALFAAAKEMLAGRDYTLRRGGVYLMGRLGKFDPRALRFLLEKLESGGSSSYEVERVLAELGAAALPVLLKALEANPKSRALRVLQRLKGIDKRALPVLVKLLASPNQGTRLVGARLLGTLGADAAPAVDVLVKALSDRDYTVRSYALRALGKIGAPAVVPLCQRLIDPAGARDRYQIAGMLAKLGPKAAPAVPTLIKCLGDKSSYLTDVCVKTLGNIGAAARAPLLAALDDPNPRVQRNAARALVRLEPATPKMLARLLAVSSKVRLRGYDLSALLNRLGPKALPPLKASLASKALAEQTVAIECAGKLRATARPLLRDLFSSLGNRRLQYQVKSALRAIGAGKPELPTLREALASADKNQQLGAVLALGGAGKIAVPLLKEILNGDRSELRSLAVSAAESLGKDAAPLVPELIAAFAERGQRWTAERALARVGAPAVEPLIGALADTQAEVRESAARALAKMTPKVAAPAKASLQALLQREPQLTVRLQAAIALGKLKGDADVCVPIILRDWEAATSARHQTDLARAVLGFGSKAQATFGARLLTDLDYDGLAVRKRAVDSIAQVGTKLSRALVEQAIPKLTAIAGSDPSTTLMEAAVKALSTFGADAQSALPTLKKLLTHPQSAIARQARYAIRRIESDLRYRRMRRR